jgi:hypothetical protein
MNRLTNHGDSSPSKQKNTSTIVYEAGGGRIFATVHNQACNCWDEYCYPLQRRIWEVPGSNLGPETRNNARKINGFRQSLEENVLLLPQIRPRSFLPCNFQFITHQLPSILHYGV